MQILGGRVVGERTGGAEASGGWVPTPPGGGQPAVARTDPDVGGSDPAGDPFDLVDLAAGHPGEPGRPAARLQEQLRRARRPSLVTVPASIRAGRVSVTSSAVVAVLALVVALGCAFAVRVLWAERAAQGRPLAQAHESDAGAGSTGGQDAAPMAVTRSLQVGGSSPPTGLFPGGAAGGAAGDTAGAAAPAEVVVHVVGQVRKPGLVRLRAGSRVADALEAAGGVTQRADVAALNLARPVSDGEQVFVPRPGESVTPGPSGSGSGGSGGVAGGGGSAGASGSGPVNLNTADLAGLETLPGVGPVLAQRIVDWRTEHGRFSSVEELGEVSGIGDKMLTQLRPKVTV
ncbi:competence protein ComEA helix-hairpin-helix repeat protein [Intrasporangium calvum DSM 43043]|uniref:Competence protein ComEA helix-hairpin-helix repeat protein n=1 Tax=Intrasporangium calvum (strain ATCC 23552 / DSM 43043 / JCM 3097 / NBRC 12989 / NCIMB 10167 / NRRL B-3866 / 7 KIP) TaxID=710696 RepID=E6S7N4_INTC7|nr:competence protein ComEA helix-hairpin-helix repeat protein [Intrasporangium calvum DSM 43043]